MGRVWVGVMDGRHVRFCLFKSQVMWWAAGLDVVVLLIAWLAR
jgi:hypothetical protein